MLLDHVWFPTMSSIKAHDQEKLLFIATTQVCSAFPCIALKEGQAKVMRQAKVLPPEI